MPLPILGALVVLGIGGLVLLVHMLGGSKKRLYEDEAAAAADLKQDYPQAQIRQTMLADDRKSALFTLSDGVGFAARFGQGRLTRVLHANDLKRVEEGPDGLTIHLADYTAPRLLVRISSAQARAVWKAYLLNRGEAQ